MECGASIDKGAAVPNTLTRIAVLFSTACAVMAEAKAIGEHAGVDATVLFETLAKGSADSFALRNHGIKAVLKDDFPLRAFSVRYARKDLNYARQLAQSAGIDEQSSQKIDALFSKAIDAGDGDRYWPVISRLIPD